MKTKTFLQIVCLAWAFVTPQFLRAQDFAGGDGSISSPYLIETADQLNNVRKYPGSAETLKYFQLQNDIDLSTWEGMDPAKGWTPIPLGNSVGGGTENFYGNFDGNGKKITGLWIEDAGRSYFGFFRTLADNSVVKDLGLVLDETKGIKGSAAIGGLVGNVNVKVTIDNCYVTGNVTGTGARIGGLIGVHNGDLTISNSYHIGNVTGGNDFVGGLIGGPSNWTQSNIPLTLTNCYAIGVVTGNGMCAGGLIGLVRNDRDATPKEVNISNCYAKGKVTSNQRVGGLFGEYRGVGILTKCYAISEVIATEDRAGGLIGALADEFGLPAEYKTNISQCYAAGSVTSTDQTGGLVGSYRGGNAFPLKDSYAINSVTGGSNTGGLIGSNVNNGLSVENCIAANASITGTTNVGRLIGNPGNATTTDCYAWDGLADTGTGNNGDPITKNAICKQTAYAAWDFVNTWKWGNEYYRLPALKDLGGQAEVQPAHLALSNDASLSGITLSIGELDPVFSAGTTSYTVEVSYITESIDITATAVHANAEITGNGTQSLAVGNNPFTIEVTAEDQVTKVTYTITVVRAAAVTDATLKSLTVSEGELDPEFSPATKAYTVNIPYSTNSITIAAEANNANANVSGSGLKEELTAGNNPFTIKVTAEDGVTEETYTVTIIRAAASTDATLKALTVSEGTLTPAFSTEQKNYSVTVDNSVTDIEITATANHDNANVSGDGLKENLTVGENSYTIEVTAEDGVTKETYTVVVTKEKGASINDVQSKAIRFFVKDRFIEVENTEGIVTLTNLMGVSQKYVSKGSLNIPVSNSGVYILTINGVSYKVLVK
jgi:hypothetical protein